MIEELIDIDGDEGPQLELKREEYPMVSDSEWPQEVIPLDMDQQSRILIESMLAEETHYNYRIHSVNKKKMKPSGEPKKKQKPVEQQEDIEVDIMDESDAKSISVVEESKGIDAPVQETENKESQESFAIELDKIKPFEMEFCPEWFLEETTLKRVNKTPERYLKIRNHIIELWETFKPEMISKSRIRPGLRGEGDVNAISRIHTFLDSIGAINVGILRKVVPKNGSLKQVDLTEEIEEAEEINTPLQVGQRRRRVRGPNGTWISASNAVATEDYSSDDGDSQPAKKQKTSQEGYVLRMKGELGKYDPFKLIPLGRYPEGDVTAIRVNIASNALVVMDMHAHLAHTEVIGLMGGKFDESLRQINVTEIFPCNSLSTNIQCEMDPSSEMEARDAFTKQGLNVVGWYHSHPTFEPTPSVRDIENQTNYQTLFRRQDGSEPFVGVIVSPYDPRTPVFTSRFQVVTISNEWNPSNEYRMPYASIKTISPSPSLPPSLYTQLAHLVSTYRTHPNRVDLTKPFITKYAMTTRLEKLVASLLSHLILGVSDNQAKEFLDRIRDVLLVQ